MMKSLVPWMALAICYAIFFSYLALSYNGLPARLATHFGINGQPNGWMSREGAVEFSLALGILLPGGLLFLVAGIGAGWLPRQFLNVPNRDYWLALERRAATAPVLLRFGLWFACMNVLFVTGVHWMIVQANSPAGGQHLNGLSTALVVGGFLLGMGIWSKMLIHRFKLKP
jgi:uncharacterized membrane protein